jgi:phosphoglucosamine mutase
MERVESRVLSAYDAVETLDGVRVDAEGGWFLIRASGTQPLVRVTAEAREEEPADELLSTAEAIVTDAVENRKR